jgi:hypothetical protein
MRFEKVEQSDRSVKNVYRPVLMLQPNGLPGALAKCSSTQELWTVLVLRDLTLSPSDHGLRANVEALASGGKFIYTTVAAYDRAVGPSLGKLSPRGASQPEQETFMETIRRIWADMKTYTMASSWLLRLSIRGSYCRSCILHTTA